MSITEPSPTATDGSADILRDAEALVEKMAQVRSKIGEFIFGQQEVVDHTLIIIPEKSIPTFPNRHIFYGA